MNKLKQTIKTLVLALAGVMACAALHAEVTHKWNPTVAQGNWNVAANWVTADGSPATAAPTTTDSVEIKPTQDTVVVLIGNVTVDSLNFSTANGAITFRGSENNITLSAPSGFSMDGVSNARGLVFEGVKIASGSELTNMDHVSKLVVTKGSTLRINDAPVVGELYLSDRSVLHNLNLDDEHVITATKLIAGAGYNRLRSKAVFGSYRSIGHLGVILVQNKCVQFTDASGITQIGGITTQFNQSSDTATLTYNSNSGDWNCNPCTIDADGFVCTSNTGSWKTSFDGAGEDDNVKISVATTLSSDVTVNALFCSAATIDLNGRTLTVKSGSVKYDDNYNGKIINGTLRLLNPTYHYRRKNANSATEYCEVVTGSEDDFLRSVLGFPAAIALNVTFGNHAWRLNRLTGLVRVPFVNTADNNWGENKNGGSPRLSVTTAPNVVWDYEGHSAGCVIGALGIITENQDLSVVYDAHYRGFGGDGCVLHSKGKSDARNGSVWLGDKKEGDEILPLQLIVGRNGYLLPGSVDYTGYREGSMRFGAATNGGRQGYTNLIFKAGSKLCVTVRENGDCTYVSTANWNNNNTQITLEPGTEIVVTKAGRFTPPKGTAYAIIRAHQKIKAETEKDNLGLVLPSGWKATLSEDGKNLSLVSNPSGFSIIIR